MPRNRDKGLLMIVCPRCHYIIDYQIIGPNGAGGRYSGPPSLKSVVQKDHVCPNCRATLRIPESARELLESIEVLSLDEFKDNYRILMDTEKQIPRFMKPRNYEVGVPVSTVREGGLTP